MRDDDLALAGEIKRDDVIALADLEKEQGAGTVAFDGTGEPAVAREVEVDRPAGNVVDLAARAVGERGVGDEELLILE